MVWKVKDRAVAKNRGKGNCEKSEKRNGKMKMEEKEMRNGRKIKYMEGGKYNVCGFGKLWCDEGYI